MGNLLKKVTFYNVLDIESDENLKEVMYYNFDEIGNNAKQYFMDSLWNYAEQKFKSKNKLTRNGKFQKSTSEIERKEILLELSKIIKQLKNKRLEELIVRDKIEAEFNKFMSIGTKKGSLMKRTFILNF